MLPSHDACWQALAARDVRWDGVFFVGVATTGVYCRPVCPARTPRAERCRFFRSAAEAEGEGFRACRRCRPELAPGRAPVDAVAQLVERAIRRIDAGFLNERSVAELADVLGVTDRHLRRAFDTVVGVSPIALAQSRRLAFAQRLVADGALPITDVAFASGFRSIRRFNAAFRARFGRAPSEARKTRGPAGSAIRVRLDYRPPLDWSDLLAFLGPRGIPGVEEIDGSTYRRTVRVGDASGVLSVRPAASRHALLAELSPSLANAVMPVVANLRALFDLDADPVRIDEHLARDRRLRPLVRRRPGLRVPGAFDPFEATIRALLGQQVSVRAATTLAGRLALRFGTPAGDGALAWSFPTAERLAATAIDDLAGIGLPGARATALSEFARAVVDGRLVLERGGDLDATIARLRTLRGFGPWTANYVAMRALSIPDAFPSGDLGIHKALGAQADELAEAWRPWRAYATLHLWASLSED